MVLRVWVVTASRLRTAFGRALIASAIALIAEAAAAGVAPEPSPEEWTGLIDQLGDPDYAVRETAGQKLSAAGAAAADALLAAAEESPDLEVALRAGWLVASIPLATGHESPEAAGLLDAYAVGDLADRVGVMRQLLRLDDDQGIESLARIVRLERTATGSRMAAALLVQDWQPGDPYWPVMVPNMLAGLGNSRRPAAGFLRGLAAYATATTPAEAAAGVEACQAVIELLGADRVSSGTAEAADAESPLNTDLAGRAFRRCLAALLAHEGRRAEALATASPLFADADRPAAVERIAAELQWLTARGLPEAVDLVTADLGDDANPFLAYAAALAWRQRPGAEAAAKAVSLSDVAHRRLDEVDLGERLGAAVVLARWGGIEWAEREYQTVLAATDTRPADRALTAISYAEFLHDQERDAAAAEALHAVLDADGQKAEDLEQGLMQLGRDPREIRSRMLFFAACAAADDAARDRLLEESLRAFPDDIDTLIALYQRAKDAPDRRTELVSRIARTAATIEQEIRSIPADPSSRNEYAWLIANTEGDLARATRYSRDSLVDSFDTASYLDTLAHCHAAAGQLERAIRTQWLAVKQEPHSRLIRRNFARFRGLGESRP